MTNKIASFSGENSFLSNFHPCEIEDKLWNIKFSTAEHMFQARKTMNPQEKVSVRDCETPGKAKRMGRKVTLRQNWDSVKVDVMFDILISKFHQNPDLARKLKETGDAELIEGNNWHDNFWGVCSCGKCSSGQNWLGKLLMDVRNLPNL